MSYLLCTLLFIFYVFFFIRSYLLSRKLKKTIKAKNRILNLSIFFAGISSLLFLGYGLKLITLPLLFQSHIWEATGTILIILGIIMSIISSLSLRDSWRIGISKDEKTELITFGIYRFSRNPYFLFFDCVLIGMFFYTGSVFIFIPAVITMVLFNTLILKEEKYLEKQHGDAYKKYKQKVRRYF